MELNLLMHGEIQGKFRCSFINKYFNKNYKQTNQIGCTICQKMKLDAKNIFYSKRVLKIMSNYFLRLWI
jgi:hypothetical protein